jgi:hypothetical protein
VDNIIAINLLQEELTLMGQPYSDADLIIQHSNKMPDFDGFRALKMDKATKADSSRHPMPSNEPTPDGELDCSSGMQTQSPSTR